MRTTSLSYRLVGPGAVLNKPRLGAFQLCLLGLGAKRAPPTLPGLFKMRIQTQLTVAELQSLEVQPRNLGLQALQKLDMHNTF